MAKITADELKAELKTAGFSDEQLTGMTKAQLESLAQGYMRQADYARAMHEGKQQVEAAKADLQRANDQLNTEMAEWATYKKQGKTVDAQMKQDLEAAQMKVTQLTARVQRVAGEHGFDAKAVLEGVEPAGGGAPPAEPAHPQSAASLRKEDVDSLVSSRLSTVANTMLDMQTELTAIAQEHQSLFGKPMSTEELRQVTSELRSRADYNRQPLHSHSQKSLNPWDIWGDQHKVDDRRAQQAKDAHDREISAAEERGRQAVLSEARIPGSVTAPGRHAPIFGTGERESALKRPQPMSTVQNAATALRARKYREGATPAS